MKKIVLIIVSLCITISSFAQFGYKNELETVNGVEIKYKIVHENFFDKSSPVQLRLKLKNTNNYDVNVNFEIQYQFDLIKKYNSGKIQLDIPSKSAKTGKMHALVFEINSTDTKIFNTEEAEWGFLEFIVNKKEQK